MQKKPGLETRLVATTLLTRVIDDKRNLDALCDQDHGIKEYLALENRDRNLARAIIVAALRHRTQIEAVLAKALDRAPPKRARHLIHSLHVAVSQILYLDVPETAAVDLAVSAIGNNATSARFRNLANAVLRRIVREREELLLETKKTGLFPKWLNSALRTDYGKSNLEKISSSMSLQPRLDLSVKSNPQEWANRLGGIVLPTKGVRLRSNLPVPQLDGFESGEWWVQDAAASLPAHLIDCAEGSNVLELCAAPGGKTAQLINRGYKVTALDISEARLHRLASNLARLGMSANLVNADILEWEPDRLYDAVLIDTPCSSTGTIRRHPDVMWTKTAEDVSELAALQYQLIDKALDFVRPGGKLVFSNCSLLKEEGEDVFAKLLASRNDLEASPIIAKEVFGMPGLINRQGAIRCLPFHLQVASDESFSGMDGFFASRITKCN